MMTDYVLSVGYLSGYGFKGGKEAAWEELKSIVSCICRSPERIVKEARAYNCPEFCEKGCCSLQTLAEKYRLPCGDLTIKIVEPKEEVEGYITQAASGDRELKEHVRRAFCRLVIQDSHVRRLEVNLQVC